MLQFTEVHFHGYNISVDIVFIIEHYFAIPKCHGCFLLMVEMSWMFSVDGRNVMDVFC